MKKIVVIIGTRPQLIKHAAIQQEYKKHFKLLTIHTGQHYDYNMNAALIKQLQLDTPNYDLKIGSAPHGQQTGKMLIAIESILLQEKPNMVIVYGDTNSTLAGALAAAKLQIPVAHIEAGLRSYNNAMPEEINRIITDKLATLLFCPTKKAVQNLAKEKNTSHAYCVGDIMVDMVHIAKQKKIIFCNEQYLQYYFATIHRPYNTDNKKRLLEILKNLQALDKKVLLAVHPRTKAAVENYKINLSKYRNIECISPVGYYECLQLQYNAAAVITDSGGMQKEAYLLQKKCVTIRTETEWLETLKGNWNTLVYDNLTELQQVLHLQPKAYNKNCYGNGTAAIAICNVLQHYK